MNRISTALYRSLDAFRRDPRGNVAVIFALATLPLIGFVGASIDFSHANAVRTALQTALDSTALMLSKEAATDTSAQLQTNAAKYVTALFNEAGVSNIQISASYTQSGGSKVTVTGSASVATSFMKVLGYQNVMVGGSSTATWGSTRLRVALVLDNTGSMAQFGKIAALQTATLNLLNQLQSAVSVNGDVYVSIIPFVKDVNVGSSNYKANWIDWTDWNANNGTCTGGGWWSFLAKTQSTCSGTWTPANHNTWNGCVTDRGNSTGPSSGNYDTNVVAPNPSITATLYAAEQYAACPAAAAMGLSYNWSAMSLLVNNMLPNGSTNQAIGLQLGWMSLVGGGPFATPPPMDPNYQYSQIIILLTDGLNTQDRWYGDGSNTSPQVDARQQMTCNNIKASGITLYTIQVNTDGDPTSTLLQNCATDPSKFFLLTSASQIVATFQAIGTNLTQLRIAR